MANTQKQRRASYAELRRRGLCVNCGVPSVDKTLCARCRKKASDRQRKRYERGICNQCGRRTKLGSLCRFCKIKQRPYSRKQSRGGKARQWQRAYAVRVKKTVFDHYGNRCVCCGQDQERFLTIGHKNNDGHSDLRCRIRKRSKHHGRRFSGSCWHARIIKLGFPDDLELQCWNCNMARTHFGFCCKEQQSAREGL
jgi:hypothetical protein